MPSKPEEVELPQARVLPSGDQAMQPGRKEIRPPAAQLFARCKVEQQKRSFEYFANGESLSVRRESQAAKGLFSSDECALLIWTVRVPDPNAAIEGGGDEVRAFRLESHPANRAISLANVQQVTRRGIPQPNVAVVTARGEDLSVMAEGEVNYPAAMPLQQMHLPPGGGVPQPHRFILASRRQQTSAGRVSDGIHHASVPGEPPHFLARADAP